MVGKIESRLLLARRIVLVVAVVCLNGYQTFVASLHAFLCQIDCNGLITAEVTFHQPAIHIDELLAHDGLEMDCDVLVLHVSRHSELFPIPDDALIVAAATCFAGLQS